MKSLFLVAVVVGCLVTLIIQTTLAPTTLAQSGNKITSSSQTSRDAGQPSKSVYRDNPVEIGQVAWGRDLDAAYARSKTSGKPVLVLFQEVPGCSGCQAFGKQVLSEPLVVEAIEDLFEPVVVFNNRSSGFDERVRKQFNEPAWNYQVVRFLDSSGKDIVPRKDGINTVAGLASRMMTTLQAADRSVPKYLQTLTATNRSQFRQAAFSMACFWTGEYELGNIDGVVETEAGWLDGREVTLVQYDPKQVSLESLATQATAVRCAQKIYTRDGGPLVGLPGGKLDRSYRPASLSDQKRQLSRWKAIKSVPGINGMQLTKINSLAPRSTSAALDWLSPRQRAIFAKVDL